MTRSARTVMILAGVVVVLCVGSYAQMEWVEIDVDRGNGPEALRNPFLAAEQFLNAQGVDTETVEGVALFDALPPPGDALMITAPRESLSPRRRDAVVAWVASGGVLFAIAHSVYDFDAGSSDDGLLDALGLFLVDPEEEAAAAASGAGEVGDEEERDEGQEGQGAQEGGSGKDGHGGTEAGGVGAGERVESARVVGETEETKETTETTETEETQENGEAEKHAAEDTAEDIVDARAGEEALEELAKSLDEEEGPKKLGELLGRAFGPGACREDEDALDAVAIGAPIDGEMVLELGSPHVLRVEESQIGDAYFSDKDQLVAMRYGEGLVVTLTSAAPFTNRRIHCHDHAWFLWYSVEDRRKVWLLHDPNAPGLLAVAMASIPGALIGGGMLVLLAAARASLRFGLAEPAREGLRRGRLAHLEAGARFQYRRGGFGALYRRLRDDLASRSDSGRSAWAARAGVPEARVEQVFETEAPRRRRDVVERVAMMIRMRRTR